MNDFSCSERLIEKQQQREELMFYVVLAPPTSLSNHIVNWLSPQKSTLTANSTKADLVSRVFLLDFQKRSKILSFAASWKSCRIKHINNGLRMLCLIHVFLSGINNVAQSEHRSAFPVNSRRCLQSVIFAIRDGEVFESANS